MKERPIIFKAEMVKAILEGRKTQTRRIIPLKNGGYICNAVKASLNPIREIDRDVLCVEGKYGQVGDRLWVRETWQLWDYVSNQHTIRPLVCNKINERICYKAECSHDLKWRPSIHMFRWASRITLEITDVRVERLQQINEEDAREEGYPVKPSPDTLTEAGMKLMKPISWYLSRDWPNKQYNNNPWVWVITFKRRGKYEKTTN